MDTVSAIAATTPTVTASSNAVNSSTVDYDAFLQLLVTQLKNQDPTEPTDHAELLSQLASFSSVEQQVQTNDRLDEIIRSNALGDATNLIGKQFTSADGTQTGIVQSVILASDGIYAELPDGSRVVVGSGSKISDPDIGAPTVSSVIQSESGNSSSSDGEDDTVPNTNSALY